ncbi:G-protein coupled receptor family C group 6 member A-like [Trichomycterus rosablanca]|uniref:G-protein coupled receptor family C group 6 member A-like n=1 Tax=Trichomycterus rosablanca TaxID=2290929 RepID=UPI002F354E6D
MHKLCNAEEDLQSVYVPGDVVIAGLFPIHNTNHTSKLCDLKSYNTDVLLYSQAMVYAIEEINNSSLLESGVKIGYVMYDTCSDVSTALTATLKLLEGQTLNKESCYAFNSSYTNSTIKAVIGERSSEISVAVARLLALTRMPQISYASTSELLKSRDKFPSFFRTVPNDMHQAKDIANLIKELNFVPVGIIGSNDEYGKYGAESLSDFLKEHDMCVEFKEIISDPSKDVDKLGNLLQNSRAEAIVLFTNAENAQMILNKTITLGINRTWIGSDAWSTSNTMLNLPYIPGRILGITCKRNMMSDFVTYVKQIINQTRMSEGFLKLLNDTSATMPVNDGQNCVSQKCLMDFIDKYDSYEPYTVYLAVKFISHALQSLLKSTNTDFSPRLLTDIIKNLTLPMNNKTFSEYGDLDIGYDILEWNKESISTIKTRTKCEKCNNSNDCDFLKWTDSRSITLGVFTTIGLLITLTVAILLIKYVNTPVVKATGGCLCVPTLVSLLGCFTSVYFFLGKPSNVLCMTGMPLFNLSFTVCVSSILANLLQIYIGFSFKTKLGNWLKWINRPAIVLMTGTSVQVALCTRWLVQNPPVMQVKTYVECSEGGVGYFIATLVYNALLCIISFAFAYKGKQLPDLYKNASFIKISMFIYLVVWIVFINVFIKEDDKFKGFYKALAILVSSYGILICHFAPKCYILVWKKEQNDVNKIAEYIRKYYENKEISVFTCRQTQSDAT